MALQLSTNVRNAMADSFESTTGTAAILRIYTGAPPANCAAAVTGTQLLTITLPSDWMNAAASGSKTKLGTWSNPAGAAGTAGYFRIWDSTATTCHAQGTVTATGGGGDMTVDNTSIASGQTVTVNTFTLNTGNS